MRINQQKERDRGMKKYQIIYADPPWEYRQSGSKTNSRGMAKQHYETMKTEKICEIPIRELCTDDCILFLWATFPNYDQALKLMEHWEFIYKTAAFVWVKKNKKSNTNFWGMGAYTRANAEPLLIGVSNRTKAKIQVKSHAVHQIVETPIEKHSKKPDIFRHKIIELLWDVPRLELFAREKTEGWDVWGNEVESDIELINQQKEVR